MSIEVEQLCFAYGERPVLSELCFTVERGSLVAVLGPNGVGKTTLFRCILGTLHGWTGDIRVDGADARTLGARKLADRIAYIPQLHQTTFAYTVLDMVLMGTAHRLSPLAVPGRRERDEAMNALERLGIAGLAERSFTRISGGEQQLTLIARALAQQADSLLMDEPTASLDYGNKQRVLKTVRGLADEGYAVLLSTHDPQHALLYADLALALCEGRVAAFGKVRDVVDAALIKRLYGLDVRLLDTEAGPLVAPVPTEGG